MKAFGVSSDQISEFVLLDGTTCWNLFGTCCLLDVRLFAN
jgi:hypothetical protein